MTSTINASKYVWIGFVLFTVVCGCFPSCCESKTTASNINEKNDGNNKAAVKETKAKKKKRLCLLPASFPWMFGPYQAQMYKLSLELDSRGYETFWMTRSDAMPEGEYHSWEELKEHVSEPPPPGFKLDHLTFVGRGLSADNDKGLYGKNAMFASVLNRLAEAYNIDTYVTLLDLGQLVPDVEFTVPFIGWFPLHTGNIQQASADIWILRNYHAVAALAPSSASAIKNALPNLDVKFIPHVIDRDQWEKESLVGLAYLEHLKPSKADRAIMEEMKREHSTIGDGHGTFRFKKNVNEKANKLFNHKNGADENTFMVLLQGGNYDEQDRKGWDTSLQAYAKFYNKYFGNEKKVTNSIKAHLWIHPIEAYIAQADKDDGTEAEANMLPNGVNIPKRIYETGLIPRSAYTFDVKQHRRPIIAALKSRADVCLHPSKVEGFGMNVLECQALGTPVITTNHTAMGDFTKLGISVEKRQMQYMAGGTGIDFALPDVDGIAEALGKLYEEHVLIHSVESLDKGKCTAAAVARAKKVSEVKDWIDSDFSSATVGDGFVALIKMAEKEFKKRKSINAIASGTGLIPPKISERAYFKVATGPSAHPDIVDWDAPWTLLAPEGLNILKEEQIQYFAYTMIMQNTGSVVVVLPVKDSVTGKDIPILDKSGSIHKDIPIMVRTYVLTALQNQVSRRISLTLFAIQHAQRTNSIQSMPNGLAEIDRERSPDQQEVTVTISPKSNDNDEL